MRRMFRLVAAAAMAALLGVVGPAGARAADGDTDVIVATGFINTAPTMVPLVGGPPAGIPFNGGTGAPAGCISYSNDDPTVPEGCWANLNGTYYNLVCGTGVAVGTVNLGEADGSADPFVPFAVELVAGVGIVLGGAAGAVTIVPNPTAPPPPVGTCGDTFIVAGVVVTG